jgi:xanthine dehydrogenase accessory factor
MSEMTEVLAAIQSRGEERMALATIVAVRGSTYRRPGARLLVRASGEWVGNVSGGCLEDDVVDVARAVMMDGEPRLVAFDLSADDEAVWGWGLGCSGAMDVFVEPAEHVASVAGPILRALEEGRSLAVVTVLTSEVRGVASGRHLLVDPHGAWEGTLGDPEADEMAAARAVAAIEDGGSATDSVTVEDGEVRAFFEVVSPPPRMVICGAGHDAIPLVRFAAGLGFRATVLDDRREFLNAERFPEAAALVYVRRTEDAAEAVVGASDTFVVVMSHNYLRDRGYLRSFLGSDVAYIGCLGPRRRLERLLEDLRGDGVELGPEDQAKLHGPAGLDLGAEGPEEIAWAIVAEVLAVRRGREAGFLRDLQGPIHAKRARAGR